MKLLDKLKQYYELDEIGFKERIAEPSKLGLPNPFTLDPYFINLINLIKDSIKNEEKIVIYGDYDVDGLTSTSILVSTFEKLGVKVGYYIPSRYIDGYGINKMRIDQFKEKNYSLIITVDNGISEIEALEYAKELGMKVIIVDHHEVLKERLPKVDAIFHQFVNNLTDYNVSAACLALFVSYGLLGRYDDYFITLAGIAVLSDTMPLKGINLLLIRLSLEYFNQNQYQPLKSILNVLKNENIQASDYSYNLIPTLNAYGRIDKTTDINLIVKLLISDDVEYIKTIAFKVRMMNDRRKEMQKNFSTQFNIDTAKRLIFQYIEAPLGMIGLLANKTMHQTDKPVCLFTDDPLATDYYVGSIRTPQGYEVPNFLKEHCTFLTRFGGHSEAAGFTINKSDIDKFKDALNEYLYPVKKVQIIHKTIELPIDDIEEAMEIITKFGPYGQDFLPPLFSVEINKSDLKLSRDGNHIITPYKGIKIVYFNHDKDIFDKGDKFVLIGELSKSTFLGIETIDFMVSEMIDLALAEII